LKRCAVDLADGFERRHHRPAGIGDRIERIAFGICLSRNRANRRRQRDKRSHSDDDRTKDCGSPLVDHGTPRDWIARDSRVLS
jgi:hypothetical protein